MRPSGFRAGGPSGGKPGHTTNQRVLTAVFTNVNESSIMRHWTNNNWHILLDHETQLTYMNAWFNIFEAATWRLIDMKADTETWREKDISKHCWKLKFNRTEDLTIQQLYFLDNLTYFNKETNWFFCGFLCVDVIFLICFNYYTTS